MHIQLVSVSHKTADVHTRACFAFTSEEQLTLMEEIGLLPGVCESVILATCNRTEIYTACDENVKDRDVLIQLQQVILSFAHLSQQEDGASLLRFYSRRKAQQHLFMVAAGLDSMIMGEDQILGQVKLAHQQAMSEGFCGTYLNTLFRMAVTSAKKVKTETMLSKTSVSTGTLVVKAAEQALGSLDDKRIMLIGASGKIGDIVLRNIVSASRAYIYMTSRRLVSGMFTVSEIGRNCRDIAFADRYDYLDICDVIISATSSPHYTLTADKVNHALKTEKTRVFIDLAVPMDIEERISSRRNICYHIDDFEQIAQANQQIKAHEAITAGTMTAEEEEQFERWRLFQDSFKRVSQFKENLLHGIETEGADKTVSKWLYRTRETASVEELEVFLKLISQEAEGE